MRYALLALLVAPLFGMPLPLLPLHLLLKQQRRSRVTPRHLQERVLWGLHLPLRLWPE